eukprot:gene5722-6306_t
MRRLFQLLPFCQASLSAGLLAGSLHALTGSDHIAAILPLSVNKRWYDSGVYGLVWGLGHGFTSFALGYMAYAMKGFFLQTSEFLVNYQYMGDLIVAVTLFVIGVMGIYESAEEEEGGEAEEMLGESSSPACEASSKSSTKKMTESSRKIIKMVFAFSTVLMNGASLGLSWDGLPSLAPAIVLDNFMVLVFLLAYLVSTMVTMGCAAGLIGETSYWVSQSSENANLARRLAHLSSLSACAIGVCWMISAVVRFMLSTHDIGNDGTAMASDNSLLRFFENGGSAWLSLASFLVILVVMVVAVVNGSPSNSSSTSFTLCPKLYKKKVDIEEAHHAVIQA